MQHRGEKTLDIAGRPADVVEVLPEPEVLYLPLWSPRFNFSKLLVADGQEIHQGDVLARDHANCCVPLLAPRAGTVDLSAVDRHITLDNVTRVPERPYDPSDDLIHPTGETMHTPGVACFKLVGYGAWQFFRDAYTNAAPRPMDKPAAVIVSLMSLDSFTARGDVLARRRMRGFVRGLRYLEHLIGSARIHLVVPVDARALADDLAGELRGCRWLRLVTLSSSRCPGGCAGLAGELGLADEGRASVWATDASGILAVDRALTVAQPCTVRIVSLGGPGVKHPLHLKAMPGYPLADILKGRLRDDDCQVINGGVNSGRPMGEMKGLDVECQGLTVLDA